jgi:hypothetical protein
LRGVFLTFSLGFPIFILSCGFGGVLNISRAMRSVASSRLGFGDLAMVLADPAKVIVTIPDNYLVAIGKVCVQWGNLEAVMELCITKLSDMDMWDPRSKIILNHMAWPMRVDIFSSIANHLMSEHPRLRDYQTVIPKLKKAQEGRNRVVHSHWGFEEGKVKTQRASARGKLKLYLEEITVEELESILHDINVACAALYNLVLGNP